MQGLNRRADYTIVTDVDTYKCNREYEVNIVIASEQVQDRAGMEFGFKEGRINSINGL